MKKIYASLIILLATASFAQSVVITKVVAGTLPSNGCSGTTGTVNPKILELYVSGTVDFTNYRIQTESNGATDSGSIVWSVGLDLTPLKTISNSFVYLVGSGSVTFSEMYPSLTLPPTTPLDPAGLVSTNIPTGNGNDAYRIVTTDGASPTPAVLTVIDQFGNPLDIPGGTSDYSAPWAYQFSFASRKNGIGPNGGIFANDSFTYGGNGAFSAPNNNCAFIKNAIELGGFVLANNKFSIAGLKIYPNPVVNGALTITSNSDETKFVTIYNMLGKQVLETMVSNQPINVSNLSRGVYVLKIIEEEKIATKKLIIN